MAQNSDTQTPMHPPPKPLSGRALSAQAPLLRGRVLRLLIASVLGGVIGYAALRHGILNTFPIPPGWPATGLALISAALMAFILGLRGVWTIYAAALLALAIVTLVLSPPLWLYPIALLVLVGVFWNARSERVPLYLTNATTSEALVAFAPEDAVRAIDLGSGLGGTVRLLATLNSSLKVEGVETAPIPYALSKILGFISGPKNARILYRDIWNVDLAEYDLVYCFLSTEPMDRLLEKAKAEMRPGSVLVSNSFTAPNHPADQMHICGDRRQSQLYVWNF